PALREKNVAPCLILNPAAINTRRKSAFTSAGIFFGNPCHASRGHSTIFTKLSDISIPKVILGYLISVVGDLPPAKNQQSTHKREHYKRCRHPSTEHLVPLQMHLADDFRMLLI